MAASLREALLLRRSGRRRAALSLLRELAAAHPLNPAVRFQLAQTLDNLGQERQAIPHYHRALRLDRKHPARYLIYLYLASSYRKTGRPAAARRWLTKAEAMNRMTPLQSKLSRLLKRAKR